MKTKIARVAFLALGWTGGVPAHRSPFRPRWDRAGDLMKIYEGVDQVSRANNYTNYSCDISSLVAAGGTFTLRFGAVSNIDTLNLGVDNVSVVSTLVTVPEPPYLLLTALGGAAFAVLRSHKAA